MQALYTVHRVNEQKSSDQSLQISVMQTRSWIGGKMNCWANHLGVVEQIR